MTVEGQACLQAEGIPGAQSRRPGPQFQEPVPQPGGLAAGDVHLVAQRLTGIAGFRHPHLAALEGQGVQGIFHGLGDGRAPGEHRENLLALGSLDGDGGIVAGDIGEGTVVALDGGGQVLEILIRVGRVHHQEEPVLLKLVEIGVVHGPAVFVGDDAVLGLIDVQGQHIAGEDVLEKGHPVLSLHQETAHMGHIKEAARVAGIEVLRHDAVGILDGHFPPADIHHVGPRRHMDLIELRAL